MARVRVMGNVTPINEQTQEQPQTLSISKSGVSAIVMAIGTVVASIGFGQLWGWGGALASLGIGLFIVGVLLGIG